MSETRREKGPQVSIVTVNLNGEEYLEGLLSSLEAQSHPSFEILLVDNGSTDRSVELVRHCFPRVRVIEAGENLGFAGGNNLGFREAQGDYLALINNDTVVERDWLSHLMEVAEGTPEVGGVGPKILFARPFAEVTLTAESPQLGQPGLPSGELAPSLLFSETSGFEGCSYQKPIFYSGFGMVRDLEGERGRELEEKAIVFLPVEEGADSGRLMLRLRGGAPGATLGAPQSVRVAVGGTEVATLEVGEGWRDQAVEVPADLVRRSRFEVINNAGSFLEPSGRAGDRGIFEPDRGQLDAAEEVTALCGCSMLLPKRVLDEVGFFDQELFMYYEDTELSWRIRKAGYRLWYQPASRVRHFHAATSGEGSPFFQFLVARNRILMLVRHGAWRHVIRVYAEELGRCLWLLAKQRIPWREPLRTRLRIQVSLLWRVPRACLKRWWPLRKQGSG